METRHTTKTTGNTIGSIRKAPAGTAGPVDREELSYGYVIALGVGVVVTVGIATFVLDSITTLLTR